MEYLNDALKTDSEAINKLINQRVNCNEELADHLHVVVFTEDHKSFAVGLLGMVNGLLTSLEMEKYVL